MTQPGFEELYRAEQPKLVALGLALCGDRDTALELAQETMLKAFVNWATVTSYDIPGAWLRRVLINLATDRHRKASNERRALERVARRSSAPPSDVASGSWWAAVRNLPDLQRSVVALHYVDDLSIEQVARILEVTAGTVKTSLSRARHALSRSLLNEEVVQ